MPKWKKHWFEYVVSSDESDFYSDSLYVLKTFQHIWADFQMNTTKHVAKEQLNIICMCQHTAQQTIYLEIFNKMDENTRRIKRSRALTEYQTWCERIVNLFCKIYFWNWKNRNRCQYLAWYMKESIVVEDKYYFHISEVRIALVYDISPEILFERYKNVEEANNNNEAHLSLRDYFYERHQKKKFIS